MNKYLTYPIAFCLYIASAITPLNAEDRNKPLSPTRFHTITNERTLESRVVLPSSPIRFRKEKPQEEKKTEQKQKDDSWHCGTSAWKMQQPQTQKPQKEYWHCVFPE